MKSREKSTGRMLKRMEQVWRVGEVEGGGTPVRRSKVKEGEVRRGRGETAIARFFLDLGGDEDRGV